MPNDKITDEEALKRYNELPSDLQVVLFADETTETIVAIGKKHSLALDKIGELSYETGLVMLGFTKPSDYIKNLTARLGVTPEKARAIAEDINQKVFQQIRESLKKIHGIAADAYDAKPETPKSPAEKIAPPTPEIKTVPPTPIQINPLPTKGEIKIEIPSVFSRTIPVPPDNSAKENKSNIINPAPITAPDALAAKNELEKVIASESAASGSATQPTPQYKDRDPYREPIEP